MVRESVESEETVTLSSRKLITITRWESW